MIGRRACDVDEVQALAVEHQFKVVVNADVWDEAHRMMAPLGDRVVNRDDIDLGPRTPTDKMRLRRNFAKA
jgi:hypothetical protein